MSLGVDTTRAINDSRQRGRAFGCGQVRARLVFCQGDNVNKAREGGADFAGSDELIKKIQGEGWLEFDVALGRQT